MSRYIEKKPNNSILLHIWVKTNSKKQQILEDEENLIFYLRSKPIQNKANRELIKLIKELMEWCVNEQFFPYGIIKSPLLGKGGSLEFFVYLKIDKEHDYYEYKDEVNNLL